VSVVRTSSRERIFFNMGFLLSGDGFLGAGDVSVQTYFIILCSPWQGAFSIVYRLNGLR